MALGIGTSEAGGTFHSQAVAIADLLNRRRPGGEKCVVHTTLLTLEDLGQLDTGEIEFAFMASNWIGRARDGMPPFTRRLALRMVSPVNLGPVFFISLARSAVKSFSDFPGKRISLGPPGSGMAEHARVICELLGISLESFSPFYLGFAEGAEALIAGHIDAQFQRPIPNRVLTDLSERAQVRIVPYAPGQLEKVLSEAPFYRRVTIEKGAFKGVAEDVAQAGVVNVIVTHERVPEKAVYTLAQTIAENLDTLPKMNPLFKGIKDLFEPLRITGPTAFEFGGVPLHPGALRAYSEAGWL